MTAATPATGDQGWEQCELVRSARDWLADDPDPETRHELAALIDARDRAELEDRFDGLLSFGTAGLRAAMGAGPNRMNLAVVIRAAAAVATWVLDQPGDSDQPVVVVGFDARHRSADFALAAAEVLAGAGVQVRLFPEATPTPLVAYTVVAQGAAAGVMVTASHNPASDNGFKLYGADGRQIVAPADSEIAAAMAAVERASAVPRTASDDPDIVRLGSEATDAYVAATSAVLTPGGPRDVRVAYTAMHGVGAAVFRQAMAQAGFPPLVEVPEQNQPDPAFPTVDFPNPEEPGALELGLACAASASADLLVAHDPDADRLGIAVPGWRVLTGDEIGVLILQHLIDQGRLDRSTVVATTIVSSSLAGKVAAAHGIPHVQTLTGFKWISRAAGPGQRLGFGYEEALGYCVAGTVADKDGITAALVFAELVAAQRARGRTVLDVLDELSARHGVHHVANWTLRVPGPGGRAALEAAMAALRAAPPARVGGRAVVEVQDLIGGDRDRALPPADVVVLVLEGDARLVVRPSGTEPKLKCYVEAVAAGRDDARSMAEAVVADLPALFDPEV